jgi:predicted DNA-binding transcriptional regulator YafY
MAHLPIGEAERLYVENQERSWQGLYRVLERRKKRPEGLSESLIEALLPIIQRLAESPYPYPESARSLANELNGILAKIYVQAH